MGALKGPARERRRMAAPTESTTDKGVGLAMVLGAIAVLGAFGMAAAAPAAEAGWAFAVAITFAVLAVVGIHVYAE
ncbi:hypothetical protein GCM10025298_20060 [Natronobiforma cellulositropha]